MNIASFTCGGRSSFGLVAGERVIDLAAASGAGSLRDAIAAETIMPAARAAQSQGGGLPLSDVKLLPPIPNPSKVICIGLNYRAHAAEAWLKLPENPSVFLRLTNTLTAHDAPLIRPELSGEFDDEGELAIVIGKAGRHVARAAALDHVFGYSCFNDGSLRDYQFKHSLTVGKNFPST